MNVLKVEMETSRSHVLPPQGFTALHHAAQLPTKTMANLLILFGTDKNRVARVSHLQGCAIHQFVCSAFTERPHRSFHSNTAW